MLVLTALLRGPFHLGESSFELRERTDLRFEDALQHPDGDGCLLQNPGRVAVR